jgi:hypothetical protein
VDYSLFIVVAVLVMLERLEKRPGVTLAAFPSSSKERLGRVFIY